jgi:hypothetical protein
MSPSIGRHHLQVLLGALLAVLMLASAAPAAADDFAIDADASGTALGIPTADPTLYTVTVTGVGFAPTLGHFRLQASHRTDTTTGAFLRGTLSLTLGTGEKILGTYSGHELATAQPTVSEVRGDVAFSGGTGRFAKAKGSGTFGGYLTIRSIAPDGVVRETVELQLDGSLRL